MHCPASKHTSELHTSHCKLGSSPLRDTRTHHNDARHAAVTQQHHTTLAAQLRHPLTRANTVHSPSTASTATTPATTSPATTATACCLSCQRITCVPPSCVRPRVVSSCQCQCQSAETKTVSQVTPPPPLRLFNCLSPSLTARLSPPAAPTPPSLPLVLLSRSAPVSPPTLLLPSPPLLCLSVGFARCAVSAVSAGTAASMGTACGKAAIEQTTAGGGGTISQYHNSLQQQRHAAHVHYAAPFTPSGSPAPGHSTTASGIVIYPMYDASSPIASRRVDMTGFKVKTSFDAGSAAIESSAAQQHSMVDATMLRQQMQVLSRLKNHSVSGLRSTAEVTGAAMASRTESASVSSKVTVA